MQFKHAPAAVTAVFDDPNLVSAAGLVPVMRLAQAAGLSELAQARLTVPTDRGANAGAKVSSLVAGMVAGADSIDDMNLLRHGGMRRLFGQVYAPSTLGSFLRAFTFGHVRQLDAVASRFLTGLSRRAGVVPPVAGHGFTFVDLDDTIIGVHGYAKQGAGFGYSGVRGLNAMLATASTAWSAPVILTQRLRRGAAGSPRGAARIVGDALAILRRLDGARSRVLVRADSAFYGHATIGTAIKAGADVSVTARMDPAVKRAIAAIDESAWTTIEYPDAVFDQPSGRWISRAEVAEVDFTAFSSRRISERVTGRLIVRRIPDLNPNKTEQPTLFDTHRHHAFFTTVDQHVMNKVTADKTHRAHAIIEQVHADLKHGPLAHLPSGNFAANSAWLVLAAIAFNLTRTAATLADAGGRLARATTATIRRTLLHVPARLARSARRIRLHLPEAWPWQHAFERLFAITHPPPAAAS